MGVMSQDGLQLLTPPPPPSFPWLDSCYNCGLHTRVIPKVLKIGG